MTYCQSPLSTLFAPEFLIHQQMGEAYQSCPTGSRVAMGTVATLSGMLKPFLCPLLAAVGVLIMLPLAGISACQGDSQGAKRQLKAWGVSVLTLVATVAFSALTTYYLPLVWSSLLVISIVGLSVILHVRSAMRAPVL